MQEWSSTSIVSRANRFLDSLEVAGDEGKLRSTLEHAVGTLSEFKAQMLFLGFNAPFLSLVAKTRGEFEGMSEADSQDLSKQISAIRDLASAKKLTLNRVRVALSACRMGIEALDDGDKEFTVSLPLRGDYLATLISNADMLYSYHSVMEVLERECGKRSQVVFTVIYKIGGKPATAKVALSGKHNAQEYVKHIYGFDAKITESKVLNVPERLIKKRSSRICLSLAYSKMAFRMAVEEANRAVSSSQKLHHYESFMRSQGFNPGARLDLTEGYEKQKAEIVRMGLAKKKGESIELDGELSLSLALKRKVLRKSSVLRAQRLFSLHIMQYFLLKSKRSRDSSFRLTSFSQDKLLHVKDLLEELSKPPFLVQGLEGLISAKLEAESMQPRIDPKLFGSAFVFLTTDKDAKWCHDYLGVPPEALKKAAASIAGLVEARPDKLAELGLEKRSARAVKFSELVKTGERPKQKRRK